MQFDTSTINKERLGALPEYTPKANRRISNSYGMGCYMDPPGHPSYFLQSVYTPAGDEPRTGPVTLLLGHVVETAEESYEKRKARIEKLFVPLPLNHERTQLWIAHVMSYFHNCYKVNGETEILPVPHYKLLSYEEFKDKSHSDKAWRLQEQLRIDRQNAVIKQENDLRIASMREVCTIDTHRGVLLIRKYYPEFTPTDEQIHNPESRFQEDWWERYATQPSEEECPGHLNSRHGTFDNCRMCGRTSLSIRL